MTGDKPNTQTWRSDGQGSFTLSSEPQALAEAAERVRIASLQRPNYDELKTALSNAQDMRGFLRLYVANAIDPEESVSLLRTLNDEAASAVNNGVTAIKVNMGTASKLMERVCGDLGIDNTRSTDSVFRFGKANAAQYLAILALPRESRGESIEQLIKDLRSRKGQPINDAGPVISSTASAIAAGTVKPGNDISK